MGGRATLLCDAGKGAAAVLIVRAFAGSDMAVFAALGAFLGHIFPVWLGFKGGKGVATFLGVMLALYWPVGLLVCRDWIGATLHLANIFALRADRGGTRASLYDPAQRACFMRRSPPYLALLIFVMHRENIARLIKGEEPRIGRKH